MSYDFADQRADWIERQLERYCCEEEVNEDDYDEEDYQDDLMLEAKESKYLGDE